MNGGGLGRPNATCKFWEQVVAVQKGWRVDGAIYDLPAIFLIDITCEKPAGRVVKPHNVTMGYGLHIINVSWLQVPESQSPDGSYNIWNIAD